jgi:hypothetical protein
MRIEPNLNTPFGSLEVHLYHYHDKPGNVSLVIFGDVTINGVDYHLRQDWHQPENVWNAQGEVIPKPGVWTINHQDLTRKDRNDKAPFPHKAREKAEKTVLSLLPNFVTPHWLSWAKEEERQKRLQNAQEEKAKKLEEIETLNTLIRQLETE